MKNAKKMQKKKKIQNTAKDRMTHFNTPGAIKYRRYNKTIIWRSRRHMIILLCVLTGNYWISKDFEVNNLYDHWQRMFELRMNL